MVKHRPAQLFASLFAFLGFCSLHCSEAKAEAHSSSTQAARLYAHQDRVENAQLGPSKAFSPLPGLDKWTPWAFTVPESVELSLPGLLRPRASTASDVAGAREFYIRTGLSPPRLFA
jgi:hypothetical protein